MSAGSAQTTRTDRMATYANPMDLPYRYQGEPGQPVTEAAYREAADPTVVRFRGRYWLFPSHSKGYWHSTDLLHWRFVEPRGYAVDKYAPTAVVIRDRLYLTTSGDQDTIWVTDNPLRGTWTVAATLPMKINDPDLFLDDDGRLYLYQGLSDKEPIQAYELDAKTFQPIRSVSVPASRDPAKRGWEVMGDRNERTADATWIEGAWMTKAGGRYYLQYAAPATEHRAYADGVLVGDSPLGPFTYQDHNPFSVRATGFATGAGHGSTFRDAAGRWWHVGTVTISKRYAYERRLALFPAAFTARGELVSDSYLADYPHYLDGSRGLVGWMLLSRQRPVTVSSTLDGHPAAAAVDEDLRTWWSAKTGDAGEFLSIDLGAPKRIEAVQANFADQDSRGKGISRDVYNYVVEVSDDAVHWRTIIDRTSDGRDAPHDYQVLSSAVRARHVRIRNIHSPDGGKFSLYDLRVFGNGGGARPAAVRSVEARRDPADARRATFAWRAVPGAEFYVVRFGPRPDLLNQSYQIYDGTRVSVASLTKGVRYYAAVDAVNENGIARGIAAARTE